MKKYKEGVYYSENLNELCIITNITYSSNLYTLSSSIEYNCELEEDLTDELIFKWHYITIDDLVYLGEL